MWTNNKYFQIILKTSLLEIRTITTAKNVTTKNANIIDTLCNILSAIKLLFT